MNLDPDLLLDGPEDDHFHDECGVFAVYGHPEAANLTYLGLHALQHRGQESAGIATLDGGGKMHLHRQMGLVQDIFTPTVIAGLPGNIAIGHVRYSTAGSSHVRNAQPFAVDVVMALDVSTQRWLTHIPGAPEWVNTLNRSTMRPASVVFIRRSATAPDPTPVVKPARALSAPITYYYCTQTGAGGAGDGGGFCGFMSNGMRVHAGAASCDRAYRGQRFRIAGDPTGLIYTCMDTGGGVSAEHRDIWFAASDEAYTWWKQVAPTGYATIDVLE